MWEGSLVPAVNPVLPGVARSLYEASSAAAPYSCVCRPVSSSSLPVHASPSPI